MKTDKYVVAGIVTGGLAILTCIALGVLIDDIIKLVIWMFATFAVEIIILNTLGRMKEHERQKREQDSDPLEKLRGEGE